MRRHHRRALLRRHVRPLGRLCLALGLVKEGDTIEIDIPNRKIDLKIDDAEMAKRKAAFSWKFDETKYPRFLNLFVKNVGSMAHGGIWE